MVFHAEGFAGIELHYTAQLTVWSIRGFSCHHFPAAELALPSVDEPPADVPFLSSLSLLLCCCARSLPNHHCLSTCESVMVHVHLSLALHEQAMLHPQTCIPVALLVYIHTYTNMESPCNTISCLASRSAIMYAREGDSSV